MTHEPMHSATMEVAGKAYREQARFHHVCQIIVADEMLTASRALDECMRDPHDLREIVHYLATSVAARVLQTVYENDAELTHWKQAAERLSDMLTKASGFSLKAPLL